MRSERTRPRTTVLSRFSILSKRIADVFNGAAGWKHGHTYQAQGPLACAASLAVQKLLAEEKLSKRMRVWGPKMGTLLRARLQGDRARAKPFIFDVRRAGSWWWIDFDFEGDEVTAKGYERKTFARRCRRARFRTRW